MVNIYNRISFSLELNSTKHSLSNKQSELTEAAAERLNNTLSGRASH